MNIGLNIIHGLLIVLGIMTGLVKVFKMKAEVDLYEKIGITGIGFTLFAIAQIVGA